jgi:hypothetical protein
MIEVEAPDGSIVEFPDGTPQDVMAKAMQSRFGGQNARKFSPLESAGRGALQGLTLGFSDEIAGAASGAYDALTGGNFSDGYNETVEGIRAANKQAREANPWSYLGGEVGSAFLVPGAAARLGIRGATTAAKAGLGTRFLAAAKEGAIYGAAFGAGHAEGGFPERAVGAGVGAATGAAVGGVLPGAVDAVSAVGRGVSVPLRALVGNRERMAQEKVGQALVRDFSGSGQGNPLQDLVRASGKLSQQSLRVRPVGQRIANPGTRTRADEHVMLADIGGENTRNLLRNATNQNSPNAQVLNQRLNKRQHFQYKRLSDDLAMSLGDGRKAIETADQLVDLARAQSKPLFDAAFKKEVPATEKIKEVLQRPAIKRLVNLARERAENEGRDLSKETALRTLHNVKVEIDHQISNVKRGVLDSKQSWDLRTLVKLKNDLKKSIDVPEYQQALKVYSGQAALKNAIEDGADEALKMPVAEMRKKLAKMSKDEVDAYRLGASQAIMDKIKKGNFNRDRTKSTFLTPDMDERLAALIPSQRARRRFQRAVILEARFNRTRAAAQGNSTTAKQLTTGQESMQPVSDAAAVAQLALGRLTPVMQAASRYASQVMGMTPEVADRVIHMMMQNSGDAGLAAFRKMLVRAERQPQARAELAQRLNVMLQSQGPEVGEF